MSDIITIQHLSITFCFLTVVALMWRIRMFADRRCIIGWLLIAAMASLATAYFWKAWERYDGDTATIQDLWREISLFFVLTLRIALVRKEDGIL